jgi:AcrR family transcriptional regulator
MRVFWEQGYEGASLTDLTQAMGITRTSMYAAFGNKEELFRKSLARYSEGPASYSDRARQEPTAYGVAAAFLAGSVEATTHSGDPAGCLGVQGALAVGPPARGPHDALVDWRNDAVAQLETRFERAVDEADLPPGSDPAALARYLVSVSNGMAVQAASGASRADLQQVVDLAMRAWPTSEQSAARVTA